MTLSQALQTIHKHWKVLPHESKDGHEAVWIRIPPEDAAEVYAEWVGMRSDGSLIWAYTLGYGYGEGTQEPASHKEVQVLQCDRRDIPQWWKAAIITFAETFCDHDVSHRAPCFKGRQEVKQAREQSKKVFFNFDEEQR
jgi:hypothetical protein